MKLLTHNFLSSKFLKGVHNGYPLKVTCNNKKVHEKPLEEGMLAETMKKLDYTVLRNAALNIGEGNNLPVSLPDCDWKKIPKELKAELHRIIFCIEIVDGELECPDTGRKFPIKDGIPNMLCQENELA